MNFGKNRAKFEFPVTQKSLLIVARTVEEWMSCKIVISIVVTMKKSVFNNPKTNFEKSSVVDTAMSRKSKVIVRLVT
jgi:hypothetical protein